MLDCIFHIYNALKFVFFFLPFSKEHFGRLDVMNTPKFVSMWGQIGIETTLPKNGNSAVKFDFKFSQINSICQWSSHGACFVNNPFYVLLAQSFFKCISSTFNCSLQNDVCLQHNTNVHSYHCLSPPTRGSSCFMTIACAAVPLSKVFMKSLHGHLVV